MEGLAGYRTLAVYLDVDAVHGQHGTVFLKTASEPFVYILAHVFKHPAH